MRRSGEDRPDLAEGAGYDSPRCAPQRHESLCAPEGTAQGEGAAAFPEIQKSLPGVRRRGQCFRCQHAGGGGLGRRAGRPPEKIRIARACGRDAGEGGVLGGNPGSHTPIYLNYLCI